MEIPKKPVYATCKPASSNQQIFEETYILKLLSRSNPKHPITNQPLIGYRVAEDFKAKLESYLDDLVKIIAGLERKVGSQSTELGIFTVIFHPTHTDPSFRLEDIPQEDTPLSTNGVERMYVGP